MTERSYGIFEGTVRRYPSGILAVTGAVPSASGDALLRLDDWPRPEEIREEASLEYELVSRERMLYALPPGSVMSREAGIVVGTLLKLEHKGSYIALQDCILKARSLTPAVRGELVDFLRYRINLLATPIRVWKEKERWESLLRLAESLS